MTGLVVWIVAVETCRAAPDGSASSLDFDTPITSTALALAEQVQGQQPDATLRLNLSHPGRPADLARLQALQQAGVPTPGQATWADLSAVLPQLAGADRVLLYWAGHGVMHGDRRLVVTAESRSAAQLQAVDLQLLLRQLRSEADAPAELLAFFDCCAQVIAPAPTVVSPGGAGNQVRPQHAYFSATAGDIASSDTAAPGFSQAVFGTLAEVGLQADAQALHAALMRQLQQLPDGATMAELHFTQGSGDLWSAAGAPRPDARLAALAASAGVSTALFNQLFADALAWPDALKKALRSGDCAALLQRLRADDRHDAADNLADAWAQWQRARGLLPRVAALCLPWPTWLRLADAVLQPAQRPAAAELAGVVAGDALSLLLALQDTVPGHTGLQHLAALLELAAREATANAATASQAAAAAALRAAVAAEPALQAVQAAALASLPAPAGAQRVYLQLQLGEDAAGAPELLNAWLQVGGHCSPVSLPAAPAGQGLGYRIAALVQQSKARLKAPDLVVELLAPLRLLNPQRQWLAYSGGPLKTEQWVEAATPITLRWADRLQADDADPDYNVGDWKACSAVLQARQVAGKPGLACRFDPAAADPDQVDLVALGRPGPGAAGTADSDLSAFYQALRQGHPYMCWPRAPLPDPQAAAFRQQVCHFAGQQGLQALPVALCRAKASPDPALQQLWLLIDEPERNPLASAGLRE